VSAPRSWFAGADTVLGRPAVRTALYGAALFAVVVGAVLARFWGLATQPIGLFPDEAAEGVSAQRILTEPGYHPIFIDDDGGREALYAYIVAAGFRLFGASVVTLRGTSALLGVVGVVAIWLAVRRFGRGPALLAMAWAAGSLWLICVSRDGMRNVLTIAAGALALAALLSWADKRTRLAASVAGVAVGAGLWTYQPLKFTPLLVIAWLLWMRGSDSERWQRIRSTVPWAAGAYLAVAAPMIWTAVTDASNYFGRGASVLVFNPGVGATESYPLHVLRTLGMFLVTGDPNARQDVGALPLLGPLLFIPFALGVWRAWRNRRDHRYASLLLGLAVFLIPPLISSEGDAPHFLRALGLAPYVAACVGIGFFELIRFAQRAARALPATGARLAQGGAAAASAAALAGLGVASTVVYVTRPEADMYTAFSVADVQLATVAAARGPGTIAILDAYNALDLRFLDGGNLPTMLEPNQRLINPAVYSLIVAPSRNLIAAATDVATAARATAASVDPHGNAVVFVVMP
jgi:4-amino-4-deoxy-L-arabinose transferase-like glycosyltransferase